MTDRSRKYVVLGSLTLIVTAAVICCVALLLVVEMPMKACALEFLRGETPAAHIRTFLRAIDRGDLEEAEARWLLPDWELADGRSEALAERRHQIIEELVESDLSIDTYTVLDTEWWRTCCEPGVIDDPHGAGGARVRVQFLDSAGHPTRYTFDVFALGGSYWGAAEGWPARRWALRDVYGEGEEPLFWRMVWEPRVRRLD